MNILNQLKGKKGSSKEIDEAIQLYPQIISFLKQGTHEKSTMQESINALYALIRKGV